MSQEQSSYDKLRTLYKSRVVLHIIVPVVTIVILLLLIAGKIASTRIENSLKESAEGIIASQSATLLQQMNLINAFMLEQVRTGNNILQQEARRFGEPGIKGSSQIAGKEVPVLVFGSSSVNENYTIVDKVKQIAGGTATLFVKSGSDFVRVSTNVLKADQTRAVGTVLDPNGKAMAAIRNGGSFTGVVEILGKPFITCYEPIRANGEIIGIYYTGYPINSLKDLGNLIQKSKVMDSGFFALQDSKGKLLFNSETVDTVHLQTILADKDEDQEHWDVRLFKFEPWGFTLAAGIYLQEIHEQILGAQIMLLIFSAVFLFGVSFSVYYIFNSRIGRRLKKLTDISKVLSTGDVDVVVTTEHEDEIGQLEAAFSVMANGIKESALAASEIAAGRLNNTLVARSEKDVLSLSMNQTTKTLRTLADDIAELIDAGVNGKLDKRANANAHTGEYRNIVDGINRTLDSVVEPVKKSAAVLERLAEGDLTARVREKFKGDHQMIVDSINTVATSLHDAVAEVTNSVHAVASATTEISSSTEELATGAQEQSSQTSEVASAVEEMTKTIFENTKNANTSADLARDAGLKAVEGGTVVNETISGMNQISEVVNRSAQTVYKLGASSDKIGEIVQVIDDIADQTNLLALNAAIEAARAGEQGRGFAVVADEVRKLAERTTKATKEIAQMIKDIQSETQNAVTSMKEGTEEVERGKLKANRAGEMLQIIVRSTEELRDIITQVAAANEQQSATVEQISKNIESINLVTQESTNGLHQIAQTADDLNHLTENLQHLINRFRIYDEKGTAARYLN